MLSGSRQRGLADWRPFARAAVLGAALLLSAVLTAVALRGGSLRWLAWVSLVPLFQAIRSLSWPWAVAAGALWGACLGFACSAGPVVVIDPTPLTIGLLVACPALYAGLGAVLTRAIGFNPCLLAMGWILVEIAVQPVGLRGGLLGAGHGGAQYGHWVASLFGYALLASLVAAVNAALVSAWACVRFVGGHRRTWRPVVSGAIVTPPAQVSLPCLFLGPSQPRAPPPEVAAS